MGSFHVTAAMHAVLTDKDRLRALRDLALIDADEEIVFNRLTSLASQIIGAPISIMSMVGGDYQFFKSAYGLGDLRSTPLSHSFCKHVVADDAPLIVDDARVHPVVFDNGAIADLGVIGYLGFPLSLANGKTLGSFCVIDRQPRQWSEIEINIMRQLAEIVKYEIELRALLHAGSIGQAQLDAAHAEIIAFADRINIRQPKDVVAEQIRQERLALFDSQPSA